MTASGAKPQTSAEEVGAADVVVGERGSGCLDVSDVIRCGGTGCSIVWVRYVGYVPAHLEYLGRLPPQGEPHNDRAKNMGGTGWDVGVLPYW